VFRDMINDLIRFERTHTAQEFVTECLQVTEYKAQFEGDRSPEAIASLEVVKEFENTVADFTQRTNGNLADFADYLSLHSTEESDEEVKKEDKVQIMTPHNAKGLEFPVVYIIGLEEGIAPLLRSDSSITSEDIEEERRLMYVGMTRAKEILHISGAATRFLHGRLMQQTPSRFIEEIPEKYIETENRNLSEGSVANVKPSIAIRSEKDYKTGERVRHGKWGAGTILSCSGSGPKAKLVIRFDRFGRKKILAGFANLVKLN